MPTRPAAEVENEVVFREAQKGAYGFDFPPGFPDITVFVDKEVFLTEPPFVPVHYNLLTVTVLPVEVMKYDAAFPSFMDISRYPEDPNRTSGIPFGTSL